MREDRHERGARLAADLGAAGSQVRLARPIEEQSVLVRVFVRVEERQLGGGRDELGRLEEPPQVGRLVDRHDEMPVGPVHRSANHEHRTLRRRGDTLGRRAHEGIRENPPAGADDDEVGMELAGGAPHGMGHAADNHVRAYREPRRADLCRDACERIARIGDRSIVAEEPIDGMGHARRGVKDVQLRFVRACDLDGARKGPVRGAREVMPDEDRSPPINDAAASASARSVRPDRTTMGAHFDLRQHDTLLSP